MASALVRQLLDAGVHFGHQTKRWNPKMKRFIFGRRAGIYIIDLEKTEQCLAAALQCVEELAAKGQLVLFVGTKKQAKPILEEQAARCGMPYVTNRWLGGTLTNFQTIKVNIERMRTLRQQKADGFFERIIKKDAKRLGHQLERLEEHFSGLAEMLKTPGGLFVVDTKREEIAVREANRLNIPVIAICDTNTDPDLISYPIPGNDDAIRSVRLMVSLVADAIATGWRRHLETVQQAAEVERQAAAESAAAEEPAAAVAPAAPAAAKPAAEDKDAPPHGRA
ncbi:MAG: 30S ribosomal protein S2 [Candidatus Omnitrophica bacterium]|nr:30S ribosomal protein S2 [Candidatus Omnitrophota bacterium]